MCVNRAGRRRRQRRNDKQKQRRRHRQAPTHARIHHQCAADDTGKKVAMSMSSDPVICQSRDSAASRDCLSVITAKSRPRDFCFAAIRWCMCPSCCCNNDKSAQAIPALAADGGNVSAAAHRGRLLVGYSFPPSPSRPRNRSSLSAIKSRRSSRNMSYASTLQRAGLVGIHCLTSASSPFFSTTSGR